MIKKEEVQAAIEALKNDDGEAALALLEAMIASMAEEAAGEEGEEEPGEEDPDEEPPPSDEEFEDDPESEEEEDRLVAKALMRLTGEKSATAAVERYRTDQKRLEQLDRDRGAYELRERRELIAELIKLGVETPALAWDGDAVKRKPSKRLAGESIESLRKRVAAFRKTPRTQPRAPASTLGESDLTESERVALSKMNDAQKQRYLSLRKMRRERAERGQA